MNYRISECGRYRIYITPFGEAHIPMLIEEREVNMATYECPAGYQGLWRVLTMAIDQAAKGKGKERHATTQGVSNTFTNQPICTLGRIYGHGYNCGQAAKKAHEAMELPNEKAREELLGAIVYLASAHILLEERSLHEDEKITDKEILEKERQEQLLHAMKMDKR